MTVMTAEKPLAAAVVPEVIEVGGEEILTEFAKVMLEWGFYKTAVGLTFPTLDESRRVAVGRRTDRGWNTDPIPGRAG